MLRFLLVLWLAHCAQAVVPRALNALDIELLQQVAKGLAAGTVRVSSNTVDTHLSPVSRTATTDVRPQCATPDEKKKLLNIVNTCTGQTTGNCCATELATNQYAICEVGGCCIRLLGVDGSSEKSVIAVGERWSASSASSSITVLNVRQCIAINEQSSICDLTCGLAIDKAGNLLDCRSSQITVPVKTAPFTPTGTCNGAPEPTPNPIGSKIPIIAGAVGGFVALVAIAAIVFFCIRRGRKKTAPAPNAHHQSNSLPPANADIASGSPNYSSASAALEPTSVSTLPTHPAEPHRPDAHAPQSNYVTPPPYVLPAPLEAQPLGSSNQSSPNGQLMPPSGPHMEPSGTHMHPPGPPGPPPGPPGPPPGPPVPPPGVPSQPHVSHGSSHISPLHYPELYDTVPSPRTQ
jgi:hypothetical protein